MKKKYKEAEQILLNIYEEERLFLEKKNKMYDTYLRIIKKLAYKGVAEAQYDLAQHYEDMGVWGIHNPFENTKKKLYWYTKAADNGHAAAYNNLAGFYESGEGVQKDLNKALALYKRSAELGDPLGKKNYKLMLKQMKNLNSEK